MSRMMPTLLIAAALAFAQAPTASHAGSDTAQPTAPAAAAQADAAHPPVPANATARIADEGEKRICRKERRTGSNMVTRVCRTASERRKDADAARDALLNGRSIDNLDIGAQ